eukprot:scaffold442_cov268-Pinguiococcus_pyrenoidosus.AAC.102
MNLNHLESHRKGEPGRGADRGGSCQTLAPLLAEDGSKALFDDLCHVVEVRVLPLERQSHVAGTRKHLAGRWKLIVGRSEAPVHKVTTIALRAEELHGQAVGVAFLQEGLHLFLRHELGKVELNRIVDRSDAPGALGDGQHAPAGAAQTLLELLVASVVDGYPLGRHAQRVVGQLLRQILEVLRRWQREVLAHHPLVGPRIDRDARGHLRVVREQEASLAAVDHLVRLGRDGARTASVARVLAADVHAEGVRAVLRQGRPVLLANGGDLVHVSDLATHMRHQHVAAVRVGSQLAAQVIQVHGVAHGGLDVDGGAAHVLDGAGHRAEGERVADHLVARLDTRGLQHEHERAAARVERDAVIVSGVGRDGGFALGHGGLLRAKTSEATNAR